LLDVSLMKMTDLVLEVRDVAVSVDGKTIVKRASLAMPRSSVVILLGPNGSGKSTLLNAIAGHPKYRVSLGQIVFKGSDVTNVIPRTAFGIGIAVQNPPRLRGVRVRTLLEKIASKRLKSVTEVEKEVNRIARALYIDHLLDREFGVGFSGGEMKRVEIAALVLSSPVVALVDEADSGVDVDSIMLIANALEDLVKTAAEAVLIVTHTGAILRHLRADKAYVMIDGATVYEGSADQILRKLLSEGFKAFRGQ